MRRQNGVKKHIVNNRIAADTQASRLRRKIHSTFLFLSAGRAYAGGNKHV
jgi:hypothetical protein